MSQYVPLINMTAKDMQHFGHPPLPGSDRDGFGARYKRCALCADLYSEGWAHRLLRRHRPVEAYEYPHGHTETCEEPCHLDGVIYLVRRHE